MLYSNAKPQQLPVFLDSFLTSSNESATIWPLLPLWFGQGRWDYARRVDGREEGVAYHAELHAFWYQIEELPWTRTALVLHLVVQ